MTSNTNTQETISYPIQWQTTMPMLTSTILSSLLFVLLVPTVCLWVFLLGLELIDGQLTLASGVRLSLIALGLFLGLFLLGIIGILVLFSNRYDLEFTLKESGVRSSVTGKTRRVNAWVNTLLALSGKPSFAGAGLMAASRQNEVIPWEKIDHFTARPEIGEIALQKGQRTLVLLHCPPDIYPAAHRVVAFKLGQDQSAENHSR
jgi:hypothetical protein